MKYDALYRRFVLDVDEIQKPVVFIDELASDEDFGHAAVACCWPGGCWPGGCWPGGCRRGLGLCLIKGSGVSSGCHRNGCVD